MTKQKMEAAAFYGWQKSKCGRKPLSESGSTILFARVPYALREAIQKKADNEGITLSAYVRRAFEKIVK